MEEEKDKFEDLEKMEDSDWSEFFEEKEENWYEPNIFEDEVVENICANVKYIAVEGYECVEILKKKPSERRSELLYCYQLVKIMQWLIRMQYLLYGILRKI